MNSANGSMIPERPSREFGALETTMRDELDALLYLLFVVGLGVLLFCAYLIHWPFVRRQNGDGHLQRNPSRDDRIGGYVAVRRS